MLSGSPTSIHRSGFLSAPQKTGPRESSSPSGNGTVCHHHRGITTLSIPAKIFCLVPSWLSEVNVTPSRLVLDNRLIDQISALRLIFEKAHEFRKDRHLYISFLNPKVAFDTIDRASFWEILAILRAPHRIISFFQKLYSVAESCV